MAKKSTRLKPLHNIFEEKGISPDIGERDREDAVLAGCGQHKRGIGIERAISHEIGHIFIFLTSTRDGAAMHNSL